MALTQEERESNRLRQAAFRARKKAEKDRLQASQPAPPPEDAIQKYGKEHELNLAWATEQDALGVFYRGEQMPHVDLLAIYEGIDIHDKELDDEEEPKKKKSKKKKKNWPNPSFQKITIKAISYIEDHDLGDGVKVSLERPIEPDCIDNCDHKDCGREYRGAKEVDEIVSFRRWLDLRAKARLDLFWLGRLLGYGLYHMSHQYVCKQFVAKNFEGLYFPGYTLDDFHSAMRKQKRYANLGVDVDTPRETREMMLLEPRSSYKSTINRIDVVQWLISAADIRIMFITSTKDLAEEFATDVKKAHFYLASGARPSAFQMLFPEFILTGTDGWSEQPLECPARIHHQPQPSVWATSMQITSTGKHCDICKFDDAVDLKNSDNPEKREALKFRINAYEDVRDPWGFTDSCGTRYFTTDWYGTRQLPQDEGSKDIAPLLYSCRSSWILNKEDQQHFDRGNLTVKDIIQQKRAKLVHPYKLTWEELARTLKKKGERSFKNQQLNIATDPAVDDLFISQFDEDGLRAHTYDRSAVPPLIEVIQSWDTAYGDKKTSDYSVGATLGIYRDKYGMPGIVVLDVLYGKWKSSELSYHFMKYYDKHKPNRVFIEDTNGTDSFLQLVKANCVRVNCDLPSKWRVRPINVERGAKKIRVMDLQFLYSQERLWFVKGWWIDELYKQFIDYKGGKSTGYKKDDIVDAISLAVTHLPASALGVNPDPKEVEKEHEDMLAKEARSAWYQRMHGGPSPTKPKEPIVIDTPPPRDSRQELMKKLVGKILPAGMRI